MADKKYLSFNLGDTLFGVDIMLVREIIRNIEVTPVDHAPDFIHGLMNLRGRIVTLIDLDARFGVDRKREMQPTDCVVLKTSSELTGALTEEQRLGIPDDLFGLMVDDVDEVYTADAASVESPPANLNGIDEKYLDVVVKLKNDLLMVVCVPEVLSNQD